MFFGGIKFSCFGFLWCFSPKLSSSNQGRLIKLLTVSEISWTTSLGLAKFWESIFPLSGPWQQPSLWTCFRVWGCSWLIICFLSVWMSVYVCVSFLPLFLPFFLFLIFLPLSSFPSSLASFLLLFLSLLVCLSLLIWFFWELNNGKALIRLKNYFVVWTSNSFYSSK